MIVDPLLPLRPLRRGNRKQPLTGLQMLEKKGHERFIVPGTLDLERYSALGRIGTMAKLDNQEELLWKLTNRVSDLAYILGDIFQVATDGNNDDLQVREEVIRIISGASQPTKIAQRGIELLAKGVEGTCTSN